MNLAELRSRMSKSIDVLYNNLLGVHHGGVTVGLVGCTKVNYYGQNTPLQHLASIVAADRRILVSPYDPLVLKQVESALKGSGFNAGIFSKKEIVVTVPLMSGEEVAKTVGRIKKIGEETKVSIRNIRRDFRDDLADDDRKKSDKSIQSVTDEFIEKADEIVSAKVSEISGPQRN